MPVQANIQSKAPSSSQILLAASLYSIFFLFFLQLLTDFIAAVYAFGLLGTSIPPEIASVLFLFSPAILLAFRRGLATRLLLGLGALFLVCRVVETLLDTRGRMLVAGLGVALFLVLLPSLLWRESRLERSHKALPAGLGLVLAVLLAFGLRAFHSGVDLSTDGPGVVVGWLLALAGGFLWTRELLASQSKAATRIPSEQPPASPPGFGSTALLSLGLMGCLVLLYFGFAAPNVIARWTGASYPGVLALLSIVFGLAGVALALKPAWILRPSPGVWIALNLGFAIALVGSLLAVRVVFPSDPAAYPFYARPLSALGQGLFWLALVLSPVILLNFTRFWAQIVTTPPSHRALAGGFALASLFLLVLVFAHVFTTVYAYIPVVGPFFRDKFWLVYLLAWAGMFLPYLQAGRSTARLVPDSPPADARPVSSAWLVLLLAGLALIGAFASRPRPAAANPAPTLRVLTYNIQQGYSQDGLKNYDGQLALIRSENPDLIGLQECDTNRIAGGNADLVRYLADRLGFYSYYGPSPVAGTFGIALLSRYPILEPGTFYMYSQGEQTATIAAHILVGDRRYNVFVTHLGNGGPLIQQQAILEEVGNLPNVILMGDFNFRPDTEAYRLTTGHLTDAWLALWPDGQDGSGIDPARRIDHMFVSPGTSLLEAHFRPGPASDHPALLTVLGN